MGDSYTIITHTRTLSFMQDGGKVFAAIEWRAGSFHYRMYTKPSTLEKTLKKPSDTIPGNHTYRRKNMAIWAAWMDYKHMQKTEPKGNDTTTKGQAE